MMLYTQHGYAGEWISFNNTDAQSPYIPEYDNVIPKISLHNLWGTLFAKVLSMAVCLGETQRLLTNVLRSCFIACSRLGSPPLFISNSAVTHI